MEQESGNMKIEEHNSKPSVTFAHILEVGDIFRTDESYRVRALSDNDTCVHVDQKTTYCDRSKQRSVCFDADICVNDYISDRNCTLGEILRVNGISIRDKFFIVAENIDKGEDGHKILAKECDGQGNIKEDGLSLKFTQLGIWHQNTDVFFPYCIGHNREALEQIKPQKLKVR